jgi:PAS domain S-box-containing protein
MKNVYADSGDKVDQPGFRITTESLLALINASPLGMTVLDLDGEIRLWNKAVERLSGWREDEVVGHSIKVLSIDSWKAYEELRKRTLQKEAFTSLPMDVTRKDGSHSTISYSTAPILDAEGHVVGTMAVFYDITEKTRMEMALKSSLEKMSRVFDETVTALASAVEKRDAYTAGHQRRVAHLACAIAGKMGRFDDDGMKGIGTAAMLHDIGKIFVPSEILSMPGQLSAIHFELIKTHPQVRYEILKEIEFPWPIAQIVQQHHERLNGSGYPFGLAGDDIIVGARIVGVADVVEAMSAHRPYRAAKGSGAALQEIRNGRGSRYDSDVVDACLAVFSNGDFFSPCNCWFA